MNKLKSQRGFTMIEIVVVFTLIGLVGAYTMGSSYITARQRGRDAIRKADLNTISKQLELYLNDHGTYPANLTFDAAFVSDDGNTTYMQILPQDPRADDDSTYLYTTNPTQTSYTLHALLERNDDPDVLTSGLDFTDCNSGGTVTECNYGISSSDITPTTNLNP